MPTRVVSNENASLGPHVAISLLLFFLRGTPRQQTLSRVPDTDGSLEFDGSSFGVPPLFPVCQARERHCRGIQDQANPQGAHDPGEEVSMNTSNPRSGHGISKDCRGTGRVPGRRESLL